MKRNNGNVILGTVVIIFVLAGLYLYKPISFREISTVEGFVEYARSFGVVMPIAAFVITAIQAIIPVIPFVILCSANGVLFGQVAGIILTWLGTLLGATVLFFVSRKLGYEWAARTYQKANLKRIEQMDGYKGFLIILTLRLLPYFPAPLINVMAGISKINFLWFFLASAIGKLPFVVGYTLLGYNILHSKNYTLGIVIMVVILVIPFLIVRRSKRRAALQGKEP